jgi:hypothetical protein
MIPPVARQGGSFAVRATASKSLISLRSSNARVATSAQPCGSGAWSGHLRGKIGGASQHGVTLHGRTFPRVRGEVGSRGDPGEGGLSASLSGRYFRSEIVDRPPHPDPLPASGAREQRRGAAGRAPPRMCPPTAPMEGNAEGGFIFMKNNPMQRIRRTEPGIRMRTTAVRRPKSAEQPFTGPACRPPTCRTASAPASRT